jgi:putative ABC transport system permease protein
VVIAMVALSFVSLVLAGLFQRSLSAVRSMDPGFETRSRVLAAFDTSLAGDPDLDAVRFYRDLALEVSALPEVESATITSIVPLGDRNQSETLFANGSSSADDSPPAGTARDEPQDGIPAWYTSVSPGFFDTMGTTLLRGRDFDVRDRADAPAVAILNRTLALQLFGTEDVVSRSFRYSEDPASTTVEVVGVVEEGRYRQMTEPATGALFLPFDQVPTRSAYLIARAVERPGMRQADLIAPVASQVRSVASGIDSRVPLYQLEPLSSWVDGSLWLFRMGAFVGAGLGALALVLAIGGLHGVIAYSVSRRTFELGVRKALGAGTRQIMGLVLARALRLGSAGVVLGLAIALLARGGLSSLLFGVSASDPGVLVGIGLLLCLVAIIAGLRPAVGAARLDPAKTLRSD